ncbi:shikimate kinase [Aquihabitans sp. G128]|uniref:shikimate kinase n=1 Tax=Aquihabitans sp. G128 TaxID=2849779 RepID=UPI001C24D923|nr:shikimate kinase [Aquihabitans sp. G128]QXC62200.1 shikimate kinase [Aquihabitans sp. G128]
MASPDRPDPRRTGPAPSSPDHVVLVGLMGSGKTTVGRLVAAHLGRPLVDVDVEVHERTGLTVNELWERGGEAAYRPLERDIVVHLLTVGGPDVLAMPGGAVDDELVLASLAGADAFTVWLRADPLELATRIERSGSHHRPLLGDDPLPVLEEQAAERDRTYSSLADLVLDVESRAPEDLAAAVEAALREHGAGGVS